MIYSELVKKAAKGIAAIYIIKEPGEHKFTPEEAAEYGEDNWQFFTEEAEAAVKAHAQQHDRNLRCIEKLIQLCDKNGLGRQARDALSEVA